MKRCIGAMTALVLFSASTAFADIGPRPGPGPNPAPQPLGLQLGARDAKLVVKKDDNARNARLVVPVGLLVVQPPPRRVGALDGMPAVVAGLALTAAFVSGGFWLVRKNRGIATIALFLSLAVFGTSVVQADVPRTPKPAPAVPVALPANVTLDGKLTLDIVANGDTIELIVPSKMVTEAKAEPKPEAPK
jgi:hypothetical protein